MNDRRCDDALLSPTGMLAAVVDEEDMGDDLIAEYKEATE